MRRAPLRAARRRSPTCSGGSRASWRGARARRPRESRRRPPMRAGEVLVGMAHVVFAVTDLERRDEALGVEVRRERRAAAEVILPELERLAIEADADEALARC